MITQEVTHHIFQDWFRNSENYKNKFSYNGLTALYNYLEELSNDIGENIEFDPIALCCEYSEYETALEKAEEYFNFSVSDIENISREKAEKEALEYLQDNTTVIEFDGGIIVNEF